jgi:acetyl esterase
MVKMYIVNKMLKRWEKRDNEILGKQSLPDGVDANIDIPYDEDGNRGHLLDVYYPRSTRKKLPVVVDIHGGGFLYGSKEMNKPFGYHLAKRGFIVFNLNYRLALSDTKVPGQIQDVVSAINWISKHIEDYPADKEKVYIIGESAGGVLAIMATLISISERLQKLFNTKTIDLDIKSAAVICGMMRFDEPTIGYWGMRSMCFDKGYQKQNYYKNMIFENIPEMKELPPIYLTTSDEDELRKMTLDFKKTLEKQNITYQLKYFKKGIDKKIGHMFCILHPEYNESIELIEDMLNFFESSIILNEQYSESE